MALFKIGYELTSINEGGYANDADDKGGETYKGISRNSHPNWVGWIAIDSIKKSNPGITKAALNKILAEDLDLQKRVHDFYNAIFWDTLRLDEIFEQDLANELYDTGVNFGGSRAIKMIQEACNLTRSDIQLEVDGKIGSNTIKAINTHPNPKLLFKMTNVLQGEAYIEIWRRDPTQEKFIKGWFNRVVFL